MLSTTFIPAIIIMHIYNWCHSITTGIPLCTWTQITIYMAHSPCFLSPLTNSPLLPFAPLSNPSLLTSNPPCCDRIRPPRSQVACKLTSSFSPFPQPSPFQIPRTQVIKRLTKTTLRIRHLLSGTVIFHILQVSSKESRAAKWIASPRRKWRKHL